MLNLIDYIHIIYRYQVDKHKLVMLHLVDLPCKFYR